MLLSLAAALTLAQRCAPNVAPETLLSVAHAESGFDPLSIGVNGPKPQALHPATPAAAAALATRLVAGGRNIDVGIAQLNIATLRRLNLSVSDAFDPCLNLAAAARVLSDNYRGAAPRAASEQAALRVAISLYNTGDPSRGFRNGYVGRVDASAARIVPALQATRATPGAPPGAIRLRPAGAAPPAAPLKPTFDVFATRSSTLVWGAAEPSPSPQPSLDPLPGDPS